MSHEQLRQLQQARAFDGTPPESELGGLHVPFDELTGDRRYELVLSETVRRGERVALIGASGAGKSSVTAHVLHPYLDDAVPIRVRVGEEDDSVPSHGAAFARHLVHTVATFLDQHDQANGTAAAKLDEKAGGHVSKRSKKLGLTVPTPWLQNAALTYELGGVVAPANVSGQDIVGVAQQTLQLFMSAGLRPVLVLDDTDHWLVRPSLPDPAPLRAGFFGNVVRLIAEQLSDAGAVIAVHHSYLTDPNYQAATEFLHRTITLPPVPDAAGLDRILARRANRALGRDDSVSLGDVLAGDATDQLLSFHRSDPNLRRLVRVAHGALTHACDAGAPLITVGHVDQAIADL